jgi:hypothetical protein
VQKSISLHGIELFDKAKQCNEKQKVRYQIVTHWRYAIHKADVNQDVAKK